ncbi:unnamed protein product [Menidia menidia]|uniref:(Atlantic silverside) hypothetical protein n=1 Tax=Menidia menidia TaxID=238744 RepID=A0A8S4BQJ4_9TELE|nr:unnamed protein product [Menidia menidia]
MRVCLTDQTSCGCCLMQQQIHRMKTFFNTSLNELEKELLKTKNVLNSVRDPRSTTSPHLNLSHPEPAASRSAFSVALTNENSLTCLGPYRGEERLIVYKHVFINLGGGYSVDTGVFTVPRSGVYSLALTVYSDAGSPGNTLAACATLLVNGQVVAGPSETNMQDQEDSATIVIALHLKAGDKVAVNLPIGSIVLLCLLHAVFGQNMDFSWNGPLRTTPRVEPDPEPASRSAFSVALNNDTNYGCFQDLASDGVVIYKHVFLNLGDGYNTQTGIFTAPRSGVYSLAATVHTSVRSNVSQVTSASLLVNGKPVAVLFERNGMDAEDSNTVVAAVQLKAGDKVAVSLLRGSIICDDFKHYNTFTGYLLFATDE